MSTVLRFAAAVGIFTVSGHVPLGAQDANPYTSALPCAFLKPPKAPLDVLTHGAYQTLVHGNEGWRPVLVDEIRWLARDSSCVPWIRSLLFGSTYTPQLTDWVVYVGSDRVVDQLTHNNSILRTPVLHGEQFVGVIALIEDSMRPRPIPPDPAA